MSSPLPLQGDTNPHSAGYQKRQFKVTSLSYPGSNASHGGKTGAQSIWDALESPVAAGTAAVIASDPLEEQADFWTLTPQVIEFIGAPTGGTFTLEYRGFTTSPITYSANLVGSTTVEEALEGLTSINGEYVVVTGSNGGPFYVAFSLSPPLSMLRAPGNEKPGGTLAGGTAPYIKISSPAQQPGISPF